MARTILITGGARSGKSRHAETRVRALGSRAIYIATAQAFDDEMTARIARHQERRGAGWELIEAPLDLAGALDRSDGGAPRLVDCLTLWLSNLLLAERDWRPEADTLIDTLSRQAAPVVLVTNEVGAGIVPENALARAFRDAAGELNQAVAEIAEEVVLCVSGCPIQVKPQ
ncbi:bifunctional adenosylcobinamide kinase/adenosylcobinamide-phosphate guanylyltransferase [Litorisediminicola beolgyonensis]|uniref:Bifunctional adenosylcobalamin biosynthesis protein n=1 Tax=Litorisediminicola beolgyonensis TaxID=1173614 RepID=A0ABW3ZG71_9RHOB